MKIIPQRTFFVMFMTLITSIVYSQLGINTAEPTRALDVNGNIRIQSLENKENDAAYDRVLVTDINGNVEAIPITDLKGEIGGNAMENKHLYYTGTEPDNAKILTCGKFQFSFGTPLDPTKNLDIRMNLFDNPSQDTNIYYTLFRKWGDQAAKYYKSYYLSFTGLNYQVPQQLSSGLDQNEFGEIYITYPAEKNYYRVSFIGRQNHKVDEVMQNSYTIVCEKF